MRSQLKVTYRESRVNPAVIKFVVTGLVNGVAVRAETLQIHTGLEFVGRTEWIDLGFVEKCNRVFREEGGSVTYAATCAVNEAVLDQIRLTTWREDGNIYPASLERAVIANED